MTNHSFIEGIKYDVASLIKYSWTVFGFVLPKHKKMIVFDSFVGKQYSCNPRALYEYMQKNFREDVEYVWAFTNPEQFQFLKRNKNTIICRYRSLKHLYYCYVAQVIVFNFTRTNEMPTRKGQMIVQTWHGGGCYKKAGAAIGYNSSLHNRILKKHSKEITHYVSSSEYFSDEVIRNQYMYDGTILPTGMPRNDCLFYQEEFDDRVENAKHTLNIPADVFVVLYAPTFRDVALEMIEELDYEALKKSIRERFHKEAYILYRGHHLNDKSALKLDYDASDYLDMQDILLIADMLITDYSSSIWDYSFTGRPCFLFTPDLEAYRKYRGFDVDIFRWGFSVCVTNEELRDAILTFDETLYNEKMRLHHEELKSYERGMATKEICELISKTIEGEL